MSAKTNRKQIVMTALLFTCNFSAFSKDFGVIGPVYPIIEADLLIEMKNNFLKNKDHINDGLKDMQINATLAMDRPPAVGLSRTQTTSVHRVEISSAKPSFASMQDTLLFYNADDPAQTQWAQVQNNKLQNHTKLILVGGSVSSQMRLFNKSVYFDQGAFITQRLQIHHVPAIAYQKGTQLVIEEVLP